MTERRDDSSSWARQWEIFHAALECPAAERTQFLADQCPDPGLRREVEELLTTHEGSNGPLDKPPEVPPELLRPDSSESATLLGELQSFLEPGTILAGRFEIVQLLGQGGMGSVYEAEDRALETRVAVKILRPEISRSMSANQRFRREIQLALQVTHPNVCRLFDLFQDGDLSFLSMELLDGTTLAERLKHKGGIRSDEALPVVKQIAAALDAAHRVGIVHRDLKSANVMLVPEGTGVRAVVTDFGLATTSTPGDRGLQHLTRTGQLLGTPAFMAPEQLEGGEITPASDIYAFGVVMYEMLTGELPFEGSTPYSVAALRLHGEAPSPRRHLPDLESRWERTILRCLERKPGDRFEVAEEIVTALESDRVPLARSQKRRLARRFRWAAAIVALVLALWLASPLLLRLMRGSPAAEITSEEGAQPSVEDRAWVLVSALDNRTEAEMIDGAVEAALARELSGSDRLALAPRQRIADALQLMKRPPDTRLDFNLAREVAMRDGNVPVVVGSRLERFGGSWVLTAEITSPTENILLGTVSEKAVDEDEIPAAIDQLSNRVRSTLGASVGQLPHSSSQLARVTTASLRSVQLYTEADAAMISGNDSVAEELLDQAVAEDPEFASGYARLAYANRNQDRPLEEYLPYAARAVELLDGTNDRERFLIVGGHHDLSGQDEEAVASFETLLRLQPDHYWALHHLYEIQHRSARLKMMIPYWVAAAGLRPNDYLYNARAVWFLVVVGGRLNEAEPFFERARVLSTPEGDQRFSWLSEFLAVLPIHQAWLEHDLELALVEIERLSQKASGLTGPRRTEHFWDVGVNYEYLGMFEAAEQVYLNMAMTGDEQGYWRRRAMRGIELTRTEPGQWREFLEGNIIPSFGTSEVKVLAQAGMVIEARQLLDSLEEPAPSEGGNWARRRAAEGELALAEGRIEEAIPLLREAIDRQRHNALTSFFRASVALAEALVAKGRVETAFAVLEDASQQKPRAVFGKGGWIDMRFYLADLHRKHGHEAEAKQVGAELRSLLRFADPGSRWVRRLGQFELAEVAPDGSTRDPAD